MLARTSTLYALLEQYPFLEDYLAARHEIFGRLAEPAGARGWARVLTLSELATAMNLPWLEFLREVQAEVRRVTGASPPIIEDIAGLTPTRALGRSCTRSWSSSKTGPLSTTSPGDSTRSPRASTPKRSPLWRAISSPVAEARRMPWRRPSARRVNGRRLASRCTPVIR